MIKAAYFITILGIVAFEIATGDIGRAIVAGILGGILAGFLD